MDRTVILAFLVAGTVASVTNAEVTWGDPPIILTAEGEKAGFSDLDLSPPQFDYPEKNDNFNNLTGVSIAMKNLLKLKVAVPFSLLAPLWHPRRGLER